MRDQLNPSPCRTRLLKICRNALYAIHLFRCWRCVALRFCRPNVIIWVYLYISGCTYNNNNYISGCIYNISGCIYIYPAVLIYLRLYLYISGCIYISPAVLIIISPAVFIYFRLYLYISGCIYIYPAVVLYISGCIYKDRKNILKMNKEVRMLLPKKT